MPYLPYLACWVYLAEAGEGVEKRQEMFTHRLAVSNQPRLAKQLPHLGLHHVKCMICHYDVSAVNVQNLPWVLRPAHGYVCVLVLLQVQTLPTSHTPVHGARSAGAVAASAHHARTSSSFPHRIRTASARDSAHDSHFPQLPPYISLLILTLFIVFHHLCVFPTHLHTSNTTQHTL